MNKSNRLKSSFFIFCLCFAHGFVLAQQEGRYIHLGRGSIVPEIQGAMTFGYQHQWEHIGSNVSGTNAVDAIWKDCEANRIYYAFGNALYGHAIGSGSALPIDSTEDPGIASDFNAGQAFIIPFPGNRNRLVYFNMYVNFGIPAVFHKQNIRVGYYYKDTSTVAFLSGFNLDSQVVGAIGVLRNSNMRDYWLVTAARVTSIHSVLKVYSLDGSGVSSVPSHVLNYFHPSTLNLNALQMVVSPMNNRIVVSAAENYLSVFDFNPLNGHITQTFGFDFYRRLPGPSGIFGIRIGGFSAGGERFYAYYIDLRRTNMRRMIVQFNGDAVDSVSFYSSFAGYDVQAEFPESFHLARDGRLYVATRNLNSTQVSMSRFDRPALFGNAAQPHWAYRLLYTPNPLNIQRFHFSFIVPDFNRRDRFSIRGDDSICVGQVAEYSLSENHRLDSVFWTYRDPISSQMVVDNNQILRFQLNDTGTIAISAIGYYCDSIISFSKQIVVLDKPMDFLRDTTLCRSSGLEIHAPNDFSRIIGWSNGATASSIRVSTPGWYWLDRENYCGVKRDSFYVSDFITPKSGLPKDTIICEGASSLQLLATPHNAQFVWRDGDTSLSKLISSSGSYAYAISNACTSIIDTVHVRSITLPTEFQLDTVTCESRPFVFTLENEQFIHAKWSDGYTTLTRRFRNPFYGMVELSTVCDTIQIQIQVESIDCSCKVYAPTAFSPNGDGINEKFSPVSACTFHHYHLSIYDRWGKEQFFTTDYQKGWDGNFNDSEAPEGMYTFRLHYITPDYAGLRIEQGVFFLFR